MAYNNIQPIVDHHTCAQCGTCLSICPTEAVSLVMHPWRGLIPQVNPQQCTSCGLCVKVCPGENIPFRKLHKASFGQEIDNEFFGHVEAVYSGYSHNRKIRYHGASGGVVSEILIRLLEDNKIDGALVVNMKGPKPLWPNVFIARTREEIISAQQSKYQPVPMNIGLKEIVKAKTERFAVVGLPCHFQGLRMFEQIRPDIRDRIVVRIGLFCGYNPTLTSTKFLCRRAGVKDLNDVIDIKYRDGHWPCGFRAITKDGEDHFLYPIGHFLFSHYIFERYRCGLCIDQLNELADISVGDEWRENLRESVGGWSFIVTRNKMGQNVIDQMVANGNLYIEESSTMSIYSGQYATMIYKKRGTVVFGKIQQMLGKPIPRYLKNRPYYPKLEYIIGSFLNYFIPKLSEKRIIRWLFLNLSVTWFNKYRKLIIRLFRK